MTTKPDYQFTERQILLLAFSTALVAVGATALLYAATAFWQQRDGSSLTFAEAVPAGVSDPSAVSDEQNSIEV